MNIYDLVGSVPKCKNCNVTVKECPKNRSEYLKGCSNGNNKIKGETNEGEKNE